MKTPTFEQFKKTFSTRSGRKERRFIEQYGNVEFEEAYPIYVKSIEDMFSISDKIEAFEKHLIGLGVSSTQSSISESRYYNFNGVKYRFSHHVYPTGSMTSDNCIDFAANPELINNVSF